MSSIGYWEKLFLSHVLDGNWNYIYISRKNVFRVQMQCLPFLIWSIELDRTMTREPVLSSSYLLRHSLNTCFVRFSFRLKYVWFVSCIYPWMVHAPVLLDFFPQISFQSIVTSPQNEFTGDFIWFPHDSYDNQCDNSSTPLDARPTWSDTEPGGRNQCSTH